MFEKERQKNNEEMLEKPTVNNKGVSGPENFYFLKGSAELPSYTPKKAN